MIDILTFNYPLMISIIAMVSAQILKLPIQYIIDRKWTPSIVFSTGGMPSSHSAFVAALTLSIAFQEGLTSPLFAISFVFASVVIHDAIGIRREAGKHATVLNQMKEEYDDMIHELQRGKERDTKVVETKLKELLGHEPIEAITGTLYGLGLALVTYLVFVMWYE